MKNKKKVKTGRRFTALAYDIPMLVFSVFFFLYLNPSVDTHTRLKYVFFQLNVNWVCPSDLYVYNEEKDCIEMLYEWDAFRITGAAPPDVTEIDIMHCSEANHVQYAHIQQYRKSLEYN